MSGPAVVAIRPGVRFTPPAAASFRRAERDLGRRIDVNSTYRDWDLQMSMHLAWEAYVNGRGPHPGHARAVHPKYSKHTSGLALDSDDWTRPGFNEFMADHGWIRVAKDDPTERHHFEYQADRDNHRNDPTPSPAQPEEEDEDMAMKGATYKRGKTPVYILFNEVSGFYVEHSGVPASYNNEIARMWDTGSWPAITQAHATVIKRALDAVRRTALTGSVSVDIDDPA